MAVQEKELQEQFKIVDLNQDGYIDASELKKIMKNLGMAHTEEEIEEMLKRADFNGSGKIEEDDFMTIMKEYLSNHRADEKDFAKELFDVFDYDKDGFITRSELQSALVDFLPEHVSKKDVSKMIKHASRSGKARPISFKEFEDLLIDVGFISR